MEAPRRHWQMYTSSLPYSVLVVQAAPDRLSDDGPLARLKMLYVSSCPLFQVVGPFGPAAEDA